MPRDPFTTASHALRRLCRAMLSASVAMFRRFSITREHGQALTFAYLVEIGLRHRLGIEYLRLTSHRPATGFDDPSDGGWQFSYRYRY